MTIICCICPKGVWCPSQTDKSVVPTNCLGRQLALNCPLSPVSSTMPLFLAPVAALDTMPDAMAAAVFDTIYTKCRSFWRFAFVADSFVPLATHRAAPHCSNTAMWHAPVSAPIAAALCCCTNKKKKNK